jgi:hypothetical protein
VGDPPDDSWEGDEGAAERRLRDLRGRVKAARAAVSTTPGAGEVLTHDWVRAAHFYAAFRITETQFRKGVPASEDLSQSGIPGESEVASYFVGMQP